MKRAFKIVGLIGALLVLLAIAACSPGPASTTAATTSAATSPTDPVSAVRAYADTATDTTLQGLSESNLAKYTHYGNDAFKAALTQEILDQTAGMIKSQLGEYQSIEFLSTEEDQGYTIVHYKAKFSKGEVGVRMVFDKDHLVAGQWFE